MPNLKRSTGGLAALRESLFPNAAPNGASGWPYLPYRLDAGTAGKIPFRLPGPGALERHLVTKTFIPNRNAARNSKNECGTTGSCGGILHRGAMQITGRFSSRMLKDPERQIPRALKSPRNDKAKGLGFGAAEAAPLQGALLRVLQQPASSPRRRQSARGKGRGG